MRRPGERGSMSLEIVILAPIFIALLALMFALGRLSGLESLVDQAARDAARAGTAQNSRAEADAAADAVVEEAMEAAGDSCSEFTALKDAAPGAFTPVYDGPLRTYTVEIKCRVNMSDLGLFFADVDVEVDQLFTSPLDRYRGYE